MSINARLKFSHEQQLELDANGKIEFIQTSIKLINYQ